MSPAPAVLCSEPGLPVRFELYSPWVQSLFFSEAPASPARLPEKNDRKA